MERAAKAESVKQWHGVFASTGVAIVARYSGLNVAQMEALRRQMKAAGASVKVPKNRLARIAVKGTGVDSIESLLKGPTIIATSDDPVAAPRIAVEFARANSDFQILGGAMKDTPLSIDAVNHLAELPSLDLLRAKLIGLLAAPASRLARVVNTPAGNLARVLYAASATPGVLALTSVLAETDSRRFFPDDLEVDGTRPPVGKLSDGKDLPSTIVKNLESTEGYKRIEGIKEASRFLLERDNMASVATPLPPSEAFEASTLGTRLYDRIFSSDETEARRAAYSLVASIPTLRGELDPEQSPAELSEPQAKAFETGLLKLFAEMNFRYFSFVEAVRSDSSDAEHLNLHVTVKLSRKLPFLIGEKAVYLSKPASYDGRLRIGSPLAEAVDDTKTSEQKDDGTGIVAVGETDMTVRIDHIVGHRIPISVAFNRAVASVNVSVDY